MFRRLNPSETEVTIYLDDREIPAAAGESVAAALLAAGAIEFRCNPISGETRAPYCMIGNCYDCLVEIDGWPDRLACLVPVASGTRVRRLLKQEPSA
jgi:predicted molibdopterin-dependent oxidoreductase YjgC